MFPMESKTAGLIYMKRLGNIQINSAGETHRVLHFQELLTITWHDPNGQGFSFHDKVSVLYFMV